MSPSIAQEYSQDIETPREGKTVYIGSDWKTVSYKTVDDAEKTITVRAGYEIIKRIIDKYGQFLLEGDIEVNTWWTNLGMTDREVIGLYHAHGECEQFHSEIKADMDLERLPSGKCETNELVLELAILAYNILRMIGQESIGRKGTETKHKVRRRRLRTVIGNMIMMASHVTEHAEGSKRCSSSCSCYLRRCQQEKILYCEIMSDMVYLFINTPGGLPLLRQASWHLSGGIV